MSDPMTALSRGLSQIAKDLDAAITTAAGERQGWCLVVFTPRRASYISNCSRPEVVAALKGLLSTWEAGMPDIPAHETT